MPDISWLQPTGERMSGEDWQVGYARTLTVVLNGSALNERDQYGRPLTDSSFALFFNASELPATCRVPGRRAKTRWERVFDTAEWPTPKKRAADRAGRDLGRAQPPLPGGHPGGG